MSPSRRSGASPSSSKGYVFVSSLRHVAADATIRSQAVLVNLQTSIFGAILLLPKAFGTPLPVPDPGYPLLESPEHSYLEFEATPSNDTTVIADSLYFSDRTLQFRWWMSRAAKIRSSGDFARCTGNLSMALTEVGAAYQTSSNGSTSLLSLLPTAGALIGAPAKELWVLYKLMPLAGLLSMALSLGGNIIPRQIDDFIDLDNFSYGMRDTAADDATGNTDECTDFAQSIADRVLHDQSGSSKTLEATIIVLILCGCLSCILAACWFLQSGAIVVWWCTGNNWMFLWYGITVFSGMLENLANVPFSRSWTIRVSRAPRLVIPSGAPSVFAPDPPEPHDTHNTQQRPLSKDEGTVALAKDGSHKDEKPVTPMSGPPTPSTPAPPPPRSNHPAKSVNEKRILEKLARGYNTVGTVTLQEPWSASLYPIYVIISQEGVSFPHRLLRVISKLIAVGAFTFGTALFASSSLVTILAATITMILVLAAGIFGRVAAMWLSRVLMKDRPIVHKVVKRKDDPNRYVEALLREDGLVCEVMGHVVVDGRVVKRDRRPLKWSMIFGVLAPPFDLRKLAKSPSVRTQ
ncbi:hypothetical protein BDV95DRAFT_577273 [Massariosphaeria phaeospora]|uniref:Uncharacterized protein n=1 Tax=Massariosphaeria phaeospora TaxID=100035 RepID=A0A7C8M5R0_9PLEO|nr:hypothetical protein BDV95DRAFT_577273 [Massariosphaeria phaeospora]